MRTCWCWLGILGMVFVSGCNPSGQAQASPTPSTSPASTAGLLPSAAYAIPGGCGNTGLYRGGFPDWIKAGVAGLTGMDDSVYAIASPPIAVGFLLGYPLTLGSPGPPKVMWLVGTPRNGSALAIEAHPLASSTPIVRDSMLADAGPGEIYPDGIKPPSPGCWHLTLRWADSTAGLDLPYQA